MPETFRRPGKRAESVASSRIEGLEIGARRLLRAEAARDLGEPTRDVMAAEVLGNIDAMSAAISEIGPGDPISADTLLAFHRRLLENTRQARYAGQLRENQNWIGGSEYNPCSAAFVPPPPELVPELTEDLCAFCNAESLPAVAQAAIAHAQFETIHPFADGNGRTGRGLIQLVLRRRGLATRVLPPISLVLATWAKDYVDGLTVTRYRGPSTGRQAQAGLNLRVGRFAGACQRAVRDATLFEERVQQIQGEWRTRLGSVRANSAADLLIKSIAGAPVLTVGGAAAQPPPDLPEAEVLLLCGRGPRHLPAADHASRLVSAAQGERRSRRFPWRYSRLSQEGHSRHAQVSRRREPDPATCRAPR